MTTTAKKITKNTTPSNKAKTKEITRFKALINLSSKTDKDLKKLNLTRDSICTDIVKYYKGLDLPQFEHKFKTDAIKNNVAIRLKGHKNSNTAKPLTGTAKTVISNCKKFIKMDNVIDKNTTYKEIRNAVKPTPSLSENRINLNKQLALLSDDKIEKLLKSLDK